jgi:REP element-mobilizing transposase RayT
MRRIRCGDIISCEAGFADLPQRGCFYQPRVARNEPPWLSLHHHIQPQRGCIRVSMPQSLSSVYVHIVFSTKDRFPFLSNEDVRAQVHAFLGGIARKLHCPPVLVGGVADHVHMLVQLDRSISQSDLVRELKRGSNLWFQERFPEIPKFAWQAGYGAFSVSALNLENVRAYIANQSQHHAKISFQDEFRAFLEKHRLAYDERYVWD